MVYQLAQINIGRARAEMNDPVMHGFMSNLAQINALAEHSPGFIWRLQSEAGNAKALRYFDDPLIIVNMSVWESVEVLKELTYDQVSFFKQRGLWFEAFEKPYLALWWILKDHRPTIAETKAKLDLLEHHGPTPEAFTFSKVFPQPET